MRWTPQLRERYAGASGFAFHFRIEPSAATLWEMYQQISISITDLTEVWKKVAPAITRDFVRTMETEGKSTGGKWKPLTKVYAERKKREGYPDKILQRTGSLLNKLAGSELTNSEQLFCRIGFPMSFEAYELSINYGSPGVSRLVPREFMVMSYGLERVIQNMIKKHIDNAIEDAGVTLEKGIRFI